MRIIELYLAMFFIVFKRMLDRLLKNNSVYITLLNFFAIYVILYHILLYSNFGIFKFRNDLLKMLFASLAGGYLLAREHPNFLNKN